VRPSNETFELEPRAGMLVRDPDLRDFLPVGGRTVPASLYWRRRLFDGDVTHKTAPAASEGASE
jgi:hypothetical protein